ncbi:MAG: C1 family peptidase [Dehalococcoidia bacterium]|jgi:C1A family cysteine protease
MNGEKRGRKYSIVYLIIAAVLVATFAVQTGTDSFTAADEPALSIESAPLNPDFVDYIDNPPDGCGGYMPLPIALNINAEAVQGSFAAVASLYGANPGLSYFDWRDDGAVTSVKDQGQCGTCWAFGTISAVESRVLIVEDTAYDFSEQNLVTCTDPSLVYLHADRCNAGGNTHIAADTLIKKGTRLESCQPYNTNTINTQACNNNCQTVKVVDSYLMAADDGGQIDAIKNAIYDYGPVTAAYYHDESRLDSGSIYYYPSCPHSANHLISIVGWDDSVAHPADGGSGAWIAKNSWGTSWGEDGFFYICYGSGNMVEIAYYDYKDYNPNEKLYYWDEAGLIDSVGTGSTDWAWMANVFTATQSGLVTNVDFWTVSSNTQYQIYIHDGRFGTVLTSQSGTCSEAGYYSIPLDTEISRNSGQQFTVSVRMTTPGYNYPIPVEAVYPGYSSPPIQRSVSYIKTTDGGAWTDLYSYGWNACLRARIISPPPRPTLVSPASGATGQPRTSQLVWNPSTGASSYGVQVSTVSSFATTVVNKTGVTETFFDVPEGILNWNTRYYWRVYAVGPSGSTSLWSATRYFTTALGPPPAESSDLDAVAVSSSQVNLTWTDNSDNESGFKIERKTGAGGTYSQIATVGANITSYSNTGRAAGTEYYYRVRAYSAAGNSNYCDEAGAKTLPPPPPRPTLASPASGATGQPQTPQLVWNPSTGASSYGVQVSTVSSFATTVVNETGVTETFFGVPEGILNWNTRYYWRVNAVGPSGSTSLWSATRYFTTQSAP